MPGPENMTERPANDEMIEGFRDGYDLSCPEPSANRSHSYRHGFAMGRTDRGVIPISGTAQDMRRFADAAMEADDAR